MFESVNSSADEKSNDENTIRKNIEIAKPNNLDLQRPPRDPDAQWASRGRHRRSWAEKKHSNSSPEALNEVANKVKQLSGLREIYFDQNSKLVIMPSIDNEFEQGKSNQPVG